MSEVHIYFNENENACRVQIVGLLQHTRHRDKDNYQLIAVIRCPYR